MNINEKIQLDDITFDDVIAGEGVSVETVDTDSEVTLENDKVEKVEEVKDEEVKDEEVKDDLPETPEDVVDEKEEETQEVEEDEKEEGELTVVNEILNNLGYEGDSEYSDTPEGLTKMTKDIASKIADERIDEVLEAFPLVKEHLQYVLNGGESKEFMSYNDSRFDYNEFRFEEDDARSQKSVLAEYFKYKGHDQDFITEIVEDYEDSGKLYNKAEAARQALGKVQAQERSQIVERQKENLAQEQERQDSFWNEVATTIQDSDEFAGLRVPEREKSKFFNYLSSPVTKDGQTQRDIDHADAAIDVKLAIDYLMYKGFNLEQMINTKAKTKATKSLRDKISKNENSVKNAKKRSRVTKNVDFDDLDLSI